MKYKPTFLAALLAVLLALVAAGCAREDTTPSTTTDAPVTAAPPGTVSAPEPATLPETAPETTTAPEPTLNVTVSDLAAGFTVRTVSLPSAVEQLTVHAYDSTHLLLQMRQNAQLRLALFDTTSGKFVAECTVDSDAPLSQVHYTADALTLFDFALVNDAPVCTAAYTVTYADGKLSAEAVTREVYPYAPVRIDSPDGAYQVYRVVKNGTGRAVVELHTADGKVQRLMTTYAPGDLRPDGTTQDYFGGTGYTPIRFLDSTHFLYAMYGYERSAGFAVFDVVTGESRTFAAQADYLYLGTHDGAFYAAEPTPGTQYDYSAYWKIAADGTATKLYTLNADLPALSCLNACWFGQTTRDDTTTLTVYAPDLGGKLAVIDLDASLNVNHYLGVGVSTAFAWAEGDTLYLFAPSAADAIYTGSQPAASESTAPVTTAAPETTAAPAEPLTIGSTADNFTVRTVALPGEGAQSISLTLDARYTLFITYDQVQGSAAVQNQALHLFDGEAGRFIGSVPLTETRLLDKLLRDGDATYLYAQSGAAGEVYRPVAAVSLSYGPGGLSVLNAIPGQIKAAWQILTSPDGKYTVQQNYLGDVMVTGPDGVEQRLLDRLDLGDILPNGHQVDLADVIGYTPIAFVDNTRLLYNITGYEWSRGFELIDVATGQITTFPDCGAFTVCGYADGAIYAQKRGEAAYSTDSFWRITLDGQMTCLYTFAQTEQSQHELTLEYRFTDAGWLLTTRTAPDSPTCTLTAWSHDFTTQLATAELAADVCTACTPILVDGTLCLVGRGLPETPEPVEMAEHSYQNMGSYDVHTGTLYDERGFTVILRVPTAWTPSTAGFTEGGEQRLLAASQLQYGETTEDFYLTLANAHHVEAVYGGYAMENALTGTTASGMPYVGYAELYSLTPGETAYHYTFRFAVDDEYSYHLDVWSPAGTDSDTYFATVIRPVLESVTVTLGEPVRPFGTQLFTHTIFASAVTLRFYIDEADPAYFAVRYTDVSSGRDLALPLAIPEGLTYDSARPIYAGGGGGSGECAFIVEFRQGDAVTYVSYDNFAYTDYHDWLDFAGHIVDEAYVQGLRDALPENFH